jgi:acetolactate synthase-1/2/3 large subunit
MKIKVSDYIARFYASKGIDTAFVLTGGCIVHLIDSFAQNEQINYIPVLHEQSAAMAADGYARIKGKPGLMAVTSGPGATNLLTGICCSYYDSVPVIAITGQVPSNSLKRTMKTRQLGFQETDVVSIFQPVTKYCTLVENPTDIRYELEKSYYIANEGRKGPVLLDICEDVLFASVEESSLRGFDEPPKNGYGPSKIEVTKIFKMLGIAERPVLILGGGIRQSSDLELCKKFIDTLNIPVLLTWGAYDVIDHQHPLFAGGFGVTSGKAGNFVIQNSDLIIAIGTRFDSHEIGSKPNSFARGAKRVVVDLDVGELEKYAVIGFRVDVPVLSSADQFMLQMIATENELIHKPQPAWTSKIKNWTEKYPCCTDEHRLQKERVNPYYFFYLLGDVLKNTPVNVVTDCGSNLIWTMQGLSISSNQRVISAFNHSPMGYSLPAAIGVALAEKRLAVICIIGDGGFQINVQELAVIEKYNLNIKIFVMNNHCHGIIQGTQNAWLEGRHHAADPTTGGLPDPDVKRISEAYEIPAMEIENNAKISDILAGVFGSSGPLLINVHMKQETQIEPKLMFGRPIEDSHPLLSREELASNMIIPLLNQ